MLSGKKKATKTVKYNRAQRRNSPIKIGASRLVFPFGPEKRQENEKAIA